MLKSNSINPLDNFVTHGIKRIDAFTYVLLIDEAGQTLIQRIASDNSTILFNLMPAPESESKDSIAGAITQFWATPDAGPFVYLYQV